MTGDDNQISSEGTFNYTYDDEDNRTSKTNIATGEVVEYSGDHRNRLTSITTKDSLGTVTHEVDYTYGVSNLVGRNKHRRFFRMRLDKRHAFSVDRLHQNLSFLVGLGGRQLLEECLDLIPSSLANTLGATGHSAMLAQRGEPRLASYASMRLRSDERGKRPSVATSPSDRNSFNEAAFGRTRKSRETKLKPETRRCFNEAAFGRTRKSRGFPKTTARKAMLQ